MVAGYRFTCLIFMFICILSKTYAQHECHFSFGIAENFNYAYFTENGGTSRDILIGYVYTGGPPGSAPTTPNDFGKYTITAGHSWQEVIPFDNAIAKFAKLCNPSFLVEINITPFFWLCTGVQAEEKHYDLFINDDQLGSRRVANHGFINLGIPVYFKHFSALPRKWALFELAGVSINLPAFSSYQNTSSSDENYSASIISNPYPLFSVGGGVSKTLGKDGSKISFEVIYSKGLYNTLNDSIVKTYHTGPVHSNEINQISNIGMNGTGWRIGIRYTFPRIW